MITTCAILFNGCYSNAYYTDKAVQKARQSALDHLRFLTPNQRAYIEFNKPVLMYEPIFRSSGAASANLEQTCIVWHVPQIKESVVVFGTGRSNLEGWDVNQILLKEFKPEDILRDTAVKKAVGYAMNNMLFLSTKERNHIRFSPPQILITDFDISTTVKLVEKDIYAIKALKKDFSNTTQVSLVWNSSEKGHKVVVTGLATTGFKNWTAITGMQRTTKDLFDHTLKFDAKSKEIGK